jgi:hypothetical protein
MIVTTSNAAISIACRNAILAVVPRALWEAAYLEARQVAAGSMNDIAGERAYWLDYWGKLGVKPAEVFYAIGVNGPDDITLEHLALLVGYQNAVKEGEATIASIFHADQPPAPSQKAENLTQALKESKPAPKKTEPPKKVPAEPEPWEPGANG